MVLPRKLLAVVGFFISSATLADDSDWSLTLLTEHNPPHSYIDEDTGDFTGGAVKIVAALMDEVGIQYEMVQLPWNRAYRRALTEKNVCVFPTNNTPERQPLFQWVTPIQSGGWAVFQRHDSNIEIENVADLKKYGIVGKMASVATDELEKALDVEIARAADDIGAVRLMYGGRVDLWLSGYSNGPEAARMAGYPNPKIAFYWKPAEVGLTCSPTTDAAIMKALNEANSARLAKLQ